MVTGETRGQERRVSCKKRGAVPSSGIRLPRLTSRLLPKMTPKHAPALAAEEEKR